MGSQVYGYYGNLIVSTYLAPNNNIMSDRHVDFGLGKSYVIIQGNPNRAQRDFGGVSWDIDHMWSWLILYHILSRDNMMRTLLSQGFKKVLCAKGSILIHCPFCSSE